MNVSENDAPDSRPPANVSGAKKSAFPSFFPPMLAGLSEKPFSKEGWIYEPKLDGMRCIAFVNGNDVKLLSRRGQNISSQYPALAAALPALCKCPVVLDGEIIALAQDGRPSFQLLQKRMNLLKGIDIERAEAGIPVHFFVFDLVYADGHNLASCALSKRKELLNSFLFESSQVRILKYFSDDGRIAYQASVENGFEGIVAKRFNSPYEAGRRSASWLKVKAQKTAEFVIGGYSAGQGARASTFGSVLLGYYDDAGNLIYSGSAGSGFDEKMLLQLFTKMQALRTERSPFKEKPADKKDAVWLLPELVAEIKFMDWTEDRHLRNPVFLHLRYDKDAKQVSMQEAVEISELETISAAEETQRQGLREACSELKSDSLSPPAAAAGGEPEPEPEFLHWKSESEELLLQLSGKASNSKIIVEGESIALTNLDKVLFPANKNGPAISKRDFLKLIAFLSPYLLTYLRDRPLTMIRAPSGMRSRSFYQKHWNLDIPDFIETVRTDAEDLSRKDQLLCNNLAALIFLAQHNILEYHCWLSRVPQADLPQAIAEGDSAFSIMDRPEFMVFDLDVHRENEKESDEIDLDAFKKASEVAWMLKTTCDELKLPAFLKSSGRNGLHIYIPIKADLSFDQVRVLAEQIAGHLEKQAPKLISTSAVEARRTSRVFLDYQANTRGKTIAAPYTPRLTPGAGVSAPLFWRELNGVYPVDLNQYSIRERLVSIGDIWQGIFRQSVDLATIFKNKT